MVGGVASMDFPVGLEVLGSGILINKDWGFGFLSGCVNWGSEGYFYPFKILLLCVWIVMSHVFIYIYIYIYIYLNKIV